MPTANGGIGSIPPSFLEHDNLTGMSANKQRQEDVGQKSKSLPAVNAAPSAPSTAAFANTTSSNPFVSSQAEKKLSDTPIDKSIGTSTGSTMDDTIGDDFVPSKSRNYNSYQRTNTTRRIEREILSILQWHNPVRSGVILAFTVGSIILTRWYSLLQMSATALTLAIGINLIYVNFVLGSQKVLTNQSPSHPYNDVIHNEKHNMIDRASVNHYSTIITEVSETVIRALTRIIFIENTMTSIKWMSIFFVIWKVSAHVSTMDIVLMVVISAFTFPRLYISNKDVVDAQIQRGQTLIQTGLTKAQEVASQSAQDTYSKARTFVARVGTTGTDAKNTLSKHSVTMKENANKSE